VTPYTNFLYFGVLLYVAVPTIVHGLFGQLRSWSRGLIILATIFMLVIQYATPQTVWPGTEVLSLWLVIGYAVTQWIVARGFLVLRQRAKNRWRFYAAVLAGLAPLIIAKYIPVFVPELALGFLGISYLTFRSLDVIICIQDGLITELPPVHYLAFLLFFPTISSGPIDRYRRFAKDWKRDRDRSEFLQDFDLAVDRLFRGFLYKFIVAALIKQYWLDPISHGIQIGNLVSYMYAYTFYLFFDFAGYCSFAVGLSYLFGIHTPENFNRPFLARNIREFWDRWNISLSTWFRDHVYMRFVMAATKAKVIKNKHLISALGFFLTMGLMGLWHGPAWRYISYGLYHGTLLVVNDNFSRWNKQHRLLHGRVWQIASILITFQAVCFGMLIFSGRLG